MAPVPAKRGGYFMKGTAMHFTRIPGFPYFAEVETGGIFYRNAGSYHAVKTRSDGRGYLCVTLFDDNMQRKTRKVHRLIMSCQVGRPLAKEEHVDHINHVKTDNRGNNLRLRSPSENSADCAKTPRLGMRILTAHQKGMVFTLLAAGFRTGEVAHLLGIGCTTVRRIARVGRGDAA